MVKLVILESPYNAPTPKGIERNVEYARACLADSLSRGEAPFASHLLYTQALNDKDEKDRACGIEAGFAWAKQVANYVKCVVYTDRGVSPGMEKGIEHASQNRIPVEFRKLGGTWAK